MDEKDKKITLLRWRLKRMITTVIFVFQLIIEPSISDLMTFNKQRGMRDKLNHGFREGKYYK